MQNAQQCVTEAPPLDTVLACQPVFNRNQEVAAFDLKLRHNRADAPVTLENIQAAMPAIVESYTRIFQHGQLMSMPSFLKIPQQMLLDSRLPELPRKHLILEVVANTALTPELIRYLEALAGDGHRLALHDYDPSRRDLDALLGKVHIARFRLGSLPPHQLAPTMDILKTHGVDILVDGVDSQQQFRSCLELGATYFQGAFLSEAKPVAGKRIGGNKLLLLELLSKLQDPDATATSLEALAIRDPNLTYRILRIVNSAGQGAHREVDTLSQAITLLGTDEIRRWVNLFLVEAEPGKPEELTRNMLIRARMCEILAELDSQPLPVNHFIVGLLSQLDALMDISMVDLVEQLPLRAEVKAALLRREGVHGEILSEVELYEGGQFDRLSGRLDISYYEVAYRHACAWARQAQFDLCA